MRLLEALDYETDRSHVITVQTTTTDGGTDTATLTWTVSDVNVAPVINAQTVTVAENIADSVTIADFNEATTTNDTDRDGTNLVYSIQGGSSVFEINSSTGIVSLISGQTLDYEASPVHTLTIEATDGSNTAATATLAETTAPCRQYIGRKNSTRGSHG